MSARVFVATRHLIYACSLTAAGVLGMGQAFAQDHAAIRALSDADDAHWIATVRTHRTRDGATVAPRSWEQFVAMANDDALPVIRFLQSHAMVESSEARSASLAHLSKISTAQWRSAVGSGNGDNMLILALKNLGDPGDKVSEAGLRTAANSKTAVALWEPSP
jgi:hypothetical protein